jgi:RHS repeat-associated protein
MVDQPVSMDRGGARHFYHADHLGSVRKLTNLAGQAVNEYDYDSFGGLAAQIGVVSNPYAYAAREFDPESGLIYYRARYYDPRSGRFLRQYPLGLDAGDANLYRYVFNSPANLTDPFGLASGGEYGSKAGAAAGAVGAIRLLGDRIFNIFACLADYISHQIGGPDVPGATCETAGETAVNVAGALLNTKAKPRKTRELGGPGGRQAANELPHWGNPETLAPHFKKHGKDFGAKSADDYARQASEFLRRSQAERLPTKIDNTGVIRAYDPKTNTFGSYNADGTAITFYKPTSRTYFDRQPGSAPWGQ